MNGPIKHNENFYKFYAECQKYIPEALLQQFFLTVLFGTKYYTECMSPYVIWLHKTLIHAALNSLYLKY